MLIDLVMGIVAVLIGTALFTENAALAAHMKDGDDRYRGHPWLQAFEPSRGPLATDTGRVLAFRIWIGGSGALFIAVGAALVLRGLVL
jgi:hypothetical protein